MSRKAKFIQYTVCRDVASLLEVLTAISKILKYDTDGIIESHALSAPVSCLVHLHDWKQLWKA